MRLGKVRPQGQRLAQRTQGLCSLAPSVVGHPQAVVGFGQLRILRQRLSVVGNRRLGLVLAQQNIGQIGLRLGVGC